MKRLISGLVAASLLAVLVGACDDGRHDDDYGYAYPSSAYCAQYTTCGTCTPVLGCGWCYNGDGVGTCAGDPDQCTGSQFSWTWETTGCHVPADASANGDDGGVTTHDAGVADVFVKPDSAMSSDAANDADANP